MGIDASFSTIGIAIIDYSDDVLELVHKEYYKPPASGNLFERLAAVREYIISKVKEFKPKVVTLEDIIKYLRHRSNAHTVTLLAALNRTVGLAVFDVRKEPPYLFNVTDIRNTIKDGNETPEKSEMPDLISRILDFDFDFEVKSTGKIKDENYDMADAIACALCYVYLDMQNQHIPFEPIVKKKSKRKKPKRRVKKSSRVSKRILSR